MSAIIAVPQEFGAARKAVWKLEKICFGGVKVSRGLGSRDIHLSHAIAVHNHTVQESRNVRFATAKRQRSSGSSRRHGSF